MTLFYHSTEIPANLLNLLIFIPESKRTYNPNMSLLVNQEGHPKSAFLPNEPSNLARFPAPPQSRPPELGPSRSAFRAVGSQLAVNSPAVRPATSPLTRSPDMGRRRDSSDQVNIQRYL